MIKSSRFFQYFYREYASHFFHINILTNLKQDKMDKHHLKVTTLLVVSFIVAINVYTFMYTYRLTNKKVKNIKNAFPYIICTSETTESRLNYEKVFKPEGKAIVTHRISLTNIISYLVRNLNFKVFTFIVYINKNILTPNVWVFQQWIDNRLQWNGTNGPNKLTVPARLLWKPDILLYKNIGPDSGTIYNDLNVVIEPNGQVTYVPAMRLTSQCLETGLVRKSITCKWKFGSWTYSANDKDFNPASNISLSEYQHNQRFDITETIENKHLVHYDCCSEPYTDVTYTIGLRKSFF
ncbi:hypothetical protein KUTeg_023858 [Tegillarca granosa]|uniref:Neurotransmitter-gated ion-channel ligand-binding domain-containing protein n=1 Tax=Tegillarca granosa TaxID=220873 RepID=A0ABQ9E2W6_TEGGR|nr:hypothetical protein KUTeg_023858 [Tegillarca granosa]